MYTAVKCEWNFSIYNHESISEGKNLAIYKTRNTETGNEMRGMQGTRGMSTRIPGNLLEDSGECSHFSIPGNTREDSGECY